jgi:hypothetical protein
MIVRLSFKCKYLKVCMLLDRTSLSLICDDSTTLQATLQDHYFPTTAAAGTLQRCSSSEPQRAAARRGWSRVTSCDRPKASPIFREQNGAGGGGEWRGN